MKPVLFRFYMPLNGSTADADGTALLQPVGSVRGRPEAVFRMPLQHLAFWISRHRPWLEGETLEVELRFHRKQGCPRLPLLVAIHKGRPVAMQTMPLETLDATPYLNVLLRRHPGLNHAEIRFTIGPDEGEPR
jgi:hypothetical protein